MKAALVAFILAALFFAAVLGEVGAPSIPQAAPPAIRLQSRPSSVVRPAPGEVEREVREDNSGPGSVNSGRDEDSDDDDSDADGDDDSRKGKGDSGPGGDSPGKGSDSRGRG